VDRRRLIVAMDGVRALAFAGTALALWAALPLAQAPTEGVSSPALYAAMLAAALVVGGAEVFRDNAAQTMLPALVPPKGLERANGQLWSAELLTNALIGPALGAVLIGLWLPLAFGVNAVAYGLAMLMVAGLVGQFKADRPDPRPWRAELVEGFSYLRAQPLLRTLAWTTGFWNMFDQMVMIALVLHTQENLGLSAEAYGLMLAGGAVGGIAGSLLGERISKALGPVRTMCWALIVSPVGFVVIALAEGPLTVALAFAVMEFSGFVWNVVSVSTRQRMIPNAIMGRVNSIYRLLAWGMIPVGLVLSGVIVSLAELGLTRAEALVTPIWAAAGGSLVLILAVWGGIARGFAGISR
jgi:MFS family permease